jgi:hypothetical protein
MKICSYFCEIIKDNWKYHMHILLRKHSIIQTLVILHWWLNRGTKITQYNCL